MLTTWNLWFQCRDCLCSASRSRRWFCSAQAWWSEGQQWVARRCSAGKHVHAYTCMHLIAYYIDLTTLPNIDKCDEYFKNLMMYLSTFSVRTPLRNSEVVGFLFVCLFQNWIIPFQPTYLSGTWSDLCNYIWVFWDIWGKQFKVNSFHVSRPRLSGYGLKKWRIVAMIPLLNFHYSSVSKYQIYSSIIDEFYPSHRIGRWTMSFHTVDG